MNNKELGKFVQWLRDYQRTNKEEHDKHYPSDPFARIVYGRLEAINVVLQKLESVVRHE